MFRLLWGFDALVAAVVLYFFVEGLADGSVSAFNSGLWLTILLALAGVLGGSLMLRGAGYPRLALAVLLLLAFPGALYGAFVLLLVLGQPDWR